jgi:hypothetical protein
MARRGGAAEMFFAGEGNQVEVFAGDHHGEKNFTISDTIIQ